MKRKFNMMVNFRDLDLLERAKLLEAKHPNAVFLIRSTNGAYYAFGKHAKIVRTACKNDLLVDEGEFLSIAGGLLSGCLKSLVEHGHRVAILEDLVTPQKKLARRI